MQQDGDRMSLIDTCTNVLIRGILRGKVYQEYKAALEALQKMPDVKRRVDEMRLLNYQMQMNDEEIDLYDSIDQIDSQMEELSRIPEVAVFMESELALCRQLQEINAVIHQGIHLDIPDL